MPLVLGFDYGLSRIGVATGQTLTRTATPLSAIKAKDGIPDWDQVAGLVSEWKPDLLIVGLPLHADGSDSDMSVRATKFGNRLHGRFGLPVQFVNEFESTREARGLTGYRGKAGDQDGRLDTAAACVILERWLGGYHD